MYNSLLYTISIAVTCLQSYPQGAAQLMVMVMCFSNLGKRFQRHSLCLLLAWNAKKGFLEIESDRCYHAASSLGNPSLMAGNEDTLVQETGSNAGYGDSVNPWLLEERVTHMHKPNKPQVGEPIHTSSMLQMEQVHTIRWETMSIEEALTCLKHIHEPPSIEDFIYVLQKCRKERILNFVTCVHTHLCHSGLEGNGVLGNILVQLFMECKSLADSRQVFNKLVHPNDYSWTSLIQGYNDYGDYEKALHIFTTMQVDCVCPTKYTYVAVLKACAGKKYLLLAQDMHAKAITEELDKDPFIGNSLVGVYAKCGLLFEARKVFQGLLIPTIVSWTSLIAGYSEHGLGEEALYCLSQMQLEGICPNSFTFACGLKACASVGDVDRGQQIHSVIVIDRYGGDLYVGNTLVEMYGKCGSLVEAEKVFNLLPERDVVTWTTLIAGYGDHGLGSKAVNLLEHMQNQGVSMNAVTFASSIKACASIGVPYCGQIVHSNTVKAGFEQDPVVGNALVDMYAKCGSLLEAQEVFDWLAARNVISWNILIAGYSEEGFEQKALLSLVKMQLEGVCMDATSYISSLKACGSLSALDIGYVLHSLIVEDGHIKDPFVGNSLVYMYAKCNAVVEAKDVFTHLPFRSVVAWTALIAIYLEQGLAKEALNALYEMQVEGISPDDVIFLYGLQACGAVRALDRGRKLHNQIVKHGFERTSAVANTLIDMYDKCHSLAEACDLFDKLPFRSTSSWSALIAGYTENNVCGEALMLLEQMQQEGLPPNAAVFASSLKACGTLGLSKKGQELHSEIVKRGLLIDTAFEPGIQVSETAATLVAVGNALIDMYAKCKNLGDAQNIFGSMPKWSLETWNVLMIGFTRTGEDEVVFGLFERLREEGIQPNEVTFLSLLTACSHAGLVKKGHNCCIAMSKEYGISPTIEHYNCMIDLVGRAGQLKYAVKLLEEMPLHPNMSSWNTILAACRKWGNVELARRALECAMRLDENHAAAFISMYNIYADAHMWTDAKRIKALP